MTMAEGTQPSREAMSALVDGELPSAEAERLIERVREDEELRARWTRYHAGRAALAGHPARLSANFAERVHARLQEEPAIAGPLARRSPRIRGWRPSGQGMIGFAVAASVGAVTLAGLLTLRDAQDTGVSPSSTAPVAELTGGERVAGVPVPMLRPDGLATVSASIPQGAASGPTIDPEWMDEYVTSHAVMSAGGSMPGLIHSGRLAGYQADR